MRRNGLLIGEFAAKAAVTVRTVRYYDQVGLLAPASVTESGQRLYTEAELITLQQILALKLLGFSLAQIRACLRAGPQDFIQSLGTQKAMLREKRSQIDAVIRAIELFEQGTGTAAGGEGWTWESLSRLLEVMQVEQKDEWVNQYFTPKQQEAMAGLSRDSYSEEARARLAEWGASWSEEDQRRMDAQYADLAAGLQEAVASGRSAASPQVQQLAATFRGLISQFTRGDAAVESGLETFWQKHDSLPADQQIGMPWGAAEQALLNEALELLKS